jgi:Skp family chaperone for outer membrane proteins
MEDKNFDLLEKMYIEFTGLKGEFAGLKGEFAGFRTEVNGRFDKLDERMDKLEGRMDKLEGGMGKLELNQEAMNDKLDEAFEAVSSQAEINERQHQEIIMELKGDISVVELAVKRDKKAQLLIEKMNGKNDLNALASQMGVNVGEANDINFQSYSVPGVGNEPGVIGAASVLDVNKISKPIQGNTGVFVVKVISEKNNSLQDLASEKFKIAASMSYRANTEAFEALRDYAKIVDKRGKFY